MSIREILTNSNFFFQEPQNETDFSPYPFKLHYTNTTVLSDTKCLDEFKPPSGKKDDGYNEIINNLKIDQICTYNPTAYACIGDSGGGVIWNGTLIGIITSSYGLKDYPEFNINVFLYKEWIKEVIAQQSPRTPVIMEYFGST